MGVTPAIAGITFFRINNARSRVSILDQLLKKKYGSKYNVFWNSIIKQLQKLDGQRNQVVHWTTVITWTDDPFVSLIPPNYWDEDKNTPALLLEDLVEFAEKCKHFTDVLSCFLYTLRDEPFVKPTWPKVFQQAMEYPLPLDHPLSRKKRRLPS